MRQVNLEVLDLTGPADAQAIVTCLDRFAALAPDAILEVRSAGDPSQLLQRLQAEQPYGFDWWPVEQGPPRWRVHLARTENDPDEPRSILDVMSADHLRLDHLYGQLSAAFEANDLERSRTVLGELRVALGRHAQAEEQLLLPLMRAHGGPHGEKDSAQFHEDHRRMTRDFETAQQALDGGDAEAIMHARTALTDLESVLRGHYRNEENLLYPVCDKATPQGDRLGVIRQIQAF